MNYDIDDEDLIVCPYCGHEESPDVGISTHDCQGAAEASKQRTQQFNDDEYFGSKQKVRITLTQVIECWDTESSILDAQGALGWGDPGTTQTHTDTVLGYSITQIVHKKEFV